MDSLVNKIFKDKIIIITGASSGLGMEIANYFSKHDAKIIVCARNLKKLKKNFYYKKNILCKKVDVCNSEEIKKFIKTILKRFKRVDILINNAGTTKEKFIDKIENKDIYKIINTNLIAPFLFLKYLIPVMKRNNYGRIVNISSGGAINCSSKYSVYSASKAGLNTLAKSVTNEVGAYNIKINTLSPGPIKTKLFPKNKLSPKLCMPTLEYLCSLSKKGPSGKFFWFMRKIQIIPKININWGLPPKN